MEIVIRFRDVLPRKSPVLDKQPHLTVNFFFYKNIYFYDTLTFMHTY